MKLQKIAQISEMLRQVLDSVDESFIKDSDHTVKVTLYQNLCEKDFTIADKEALQMIIEKQVMGITKKMPDFLKDAETIDDVIDSIRDGSMRLNKKSMFSNKFYEAKMERLGRVYDGCREKEVDLLADFLTGYDFRTNGAVRCITYEDYTLQDKTEYLLTDEHAIENVKRAMLSFGSKHDDIRKFDESTVVVDFEDYGYLFNSDLNPEFAAGLLSAHEQVLAMKDKMNIEQADNKVYESISSVLAEFSDNLTTMFPESVEAAVLKHGELIANIADRHMHITDTEIRRDAINEIKEALSGSRVARDCVIEFIETVFDSKESLQKHIDYKMEVRRQRFASASADFDVISDEFDRNVEEAVALHKSEDSFMFKKKMQSLNAFERASVTLVISSESEPELVSEKESTKSNVVAFRR
ncbi:hypothetical protein LMH73_009125 [Vibrio splendidus]|nr:hypothetical protein [Vibrio splendidus]MCC4880314.1 hypothetical protein [Vibrio splendidus]